MKFPKGFLWGAATSAHQVEGGNHNDWTEWEKANAERLAREAEKTYARWLPSWNEIKNQTQNPDNYISGQACGHYDRFEDDFDLAAVLGHNAHRFSIEWSRVEPQQGSFNEEEVEHYRKVIKALRERNLEPFVTLWHWTLPLWLRDLGGLESEQFPVYFERYAQYVVGQFKNEVKFWMTLNEPTSIINGAYLRGVWPPQKKSVISALRVMCNLAKAHSNAYKVIRRESPEALIGFGHIMNYREPFGGSPLAKFAVKIADYFSNQRFLSMTKDAVDFLGLQYYFHDRIKFPYRVCNENKEVSDMGWEIYPEGIYHVLKSLKQYQKPIYITENGLADALDQKRAKFIVGHLYWISKAIQEGVDVRGYFYWSLLDNFEWDKGFWPRFGLVEVDYKTMRRKIRNSAWEYKKIIESCG